MCSLFKVTLNMKTSKNSKAGNICTYILVMHESRPKPNSYFKRHKNIRKHAHIYLAIYLQNKMRSLQSNTHFAEMWSTFCITHWQECKSLSLYPWPILIERYSEGAACWLILVHQDFVRSLTSKTPSEMVNNTFHRGMLNHFIHFMYQLISLNVFLDL